MGSAVQGMRPLLRHLERVRKRARDRKRAMRKAADLMVESVQRNFDEGGRPRWQAHAESTRRRLVGPQRVLYRSGALRGSFKPTATNDEASADSSTAYGARHHFGYPGGPGRGHSRTPARPFALLQDEDAPTIGERVFMRHLFGD